MTKKITIEERSPVVVVMGHVDHGKSTLLDFIRKTNIVDGEAGGITQRISAYEVHHKDEHNKTRTITFLDTPGHEAFSGMRERGALVADIAILIISAEDGFKAQTREALDTIVTSNTPYVVAINKIDKPGANTEKIKGELVENGVYLEGWGGTVSCAEISAKTGAGVNDLLDIILLTADLAELVGDRSKKATGYVIESSLDTKRGNSATLIIKDGSIQTGMFVVAGQAMSSTRIMEDFMGQTIKETSFSSPVRIVGFDTLPKTGDPFVVFEKKKEAELCAKEACLIKDKKNPAFVALENSKIIPLVIKAETLGIIEAIEKEIKKIEVDGAQFKILSVGTGPISEGDIRLAGSDEESIVLGFDVKLDPQARDMADQDKVRVMTFDIIYKLTDFLKEEIDARRNRIEVAETTGRAKILKTFSHTKEKQVVGGRVTMGELFDNAKITIIRRENEVGYGKIVGLQKNKTPSKSVEEGAECGLLIETKVTLAVGDEIEAFRMVTK
ncbi:MAG: translation initiation factor IF-2 [Candidatus Pacebacteria bacterium]|nr:translation initiation factor IF-2 [Candidatus Paceibacterota bacterium]